LPSTAEHEVAFIEAAQDDLDGLLGYSRRHYPSLVPALEKRLRQVITRLPRSARAVQGRPGVRVVPLLRYPYKIFYRITDKGIEILHIHHTARDFWACPTPGPFIPAKCWPKSWSSLAFRPASLQIRVPANRISQILAGKRSVTGDTALRLGHWFGMSPAFWLNLQSLYELRRANQAAGREIAKLPRRPAA
jgi:antitoxin HigA-1